MTDLIRTLLTRSKTLLSKDNSPPTKSTLFPLATPEDLTICPQECATCPHDYPKAFYKIGINTDHEMYGQVKRYTTHIVVATGKNDWIRDVTEEKGSVMEAIAKEAKGVVKDGRIMISASNMPLPHAEPETSEKEKEKETPRTNSTTILILPSFETIHNVRPEDTREVLQRYVEGLPTTETTLPTSIPDTVSTTTTITSHPCPHDYLILLCSHTHRDRRCGLSAPILQTEFARILRPLGLYRDHSDTRPGGVGIYFISHVGGHKYAANVIIYRKQGGEGIWLGRVTPKECESIVRWTILEGKVVDKEKLRGGFSRSEGKYSW